MNRLITPPVGKSGMSVKTTYEQRRYYDVVSFVGKADVPTIDLRTVPLYGRISPSGKIMIPNENRVRMIGDKQILDIVTQMYEELITRIETLELKGTFKSDKSFTNSLTIKSAYSSPTDQHALYTLRLTEKFFTEALDTQKMREIRNFKQFISYFNIYKSKITYLVEKPLATAQLFIDL